MSQAEVAECIAQQREEWEVLESIYPECTTTDFAVGATLKLEIPVELAQTRVVSIAAPPEVTAGVSAQIQGLATSLSMLPPILLHLILPVDYPSSSPPEIIFLHSTHSWFPNMKALHEALMGMWQPDEGVLYTWVEHIKSGQFLDSAFSAAPNDDDIELTHHTPPALLARLQAYQSAAQTSQFSVNSYPCAVCLTSLKGAKCLRLDCEHIFCRACLEDFWKLCIAEGDVGRVGCPDPACVKDNREAAEEEVARVVTQEELARWRWLREKRDLEKDPTIIHCPIATCQYPISKPKDADPTSGWDRFRSCRSCSFCFCAFCKRTWHGPITHCPISVSEKIVREYLDLPEGSSGRGALERRYGKGTILKLVSTWENELANQKWIESSTMACPGCRVLANSSQMTCSKCQQHFCYRTRTSIFSANPMSKCFGKLFDFKAEDLEWEPVEGFAALI
ncbi:hypothetical protein BD626DRAFT_500987 [Schizophyllum amplum]|uniref:RBR-type E3 ubiquitin transferase n=1 Tax=Schizophyllum amplum TaxID=97359 RepID=A0A550C9F1_9AGAR|nr:hypothetical protein BD626DRAFT_500987 [Auriculariopsis ampla]